MKIDIGLSESFAYFRNRLNNSGFAVDVHDRYQKRGILDFAQYIGSLNSAGSIWRHKINLTPHALQSLHGFQYGFVLNARCNKMGSAHLLCVLIEPQDGQIITFG